jgi:hypothetical protein
LMAFPSTVLRSRCERCTAKERTTLGSAVPKFLLIDTEFDALIDGSTLEAAGEVVHRQLAEADELVRRVSSGGCFLDDAVDGVDVEQQEAQAEIALLQRALKIREACLHPLNVDVRRVLA